MIKLKQKWQEFHNRNDRQQTRFADMLAVYMDTILAYSGDKEKNNLFTQHQTYLSKKMK